MLIPNTNSIMNNSSSTAANLPETEVVTKPDTGVHDEIEDIRLVLAQVSAQVSELTDKLTNHIDRSANTTSSRPGTMSVDFTYRNKPVFNMTIPSVWLLVIPIMIVWKYLPRE